MTTPVAITLNTASASIDSPAADAGDGFPFADILALISQPGSKQALIQALQQPEGQTPTGPHSALLSRLSQMSATQRQALLASLENQRDQRLDPAEIVAAARQTPALTIPDHPQKIVPETADATTQQAIAALLAMLPPRADAPSQTFTPGSVRTGDGDDLMRLLSPRRGAPESSLTSLLGNANATNARPDALTQRADIAPLLSAKASPTTPGINTLDTASSLVSLNTPERRSLSHDLQPGHSAQAITPTALHAAPTPATPQLSATPLASAATASAPLLNAPLGSGEWQQALGQQVLMFARNGQHQAELRLHPQDLGAVQITLRLDDNQAQLHMAAAHGQVRAALEAALPHLRTALAESGIQLGQSSIGSEAQSQWGNGQQQGQAPQPDATPFIVADNAVPTPLDAVAPTTVRRPLGAVDISV
ncbi:MULTISPECIES: flagellar hook-length control protein FliK [Edwardsiella]|uniref:Flagellar hook-length control protein FliK n=2 Tax=Edwardsiella anguillarum TaxID=1821960 RepID=A0A076LI82_9GAMM|nr:MULTISPECIES: flagellar hook-length control protein FliK [Edwardsiella]AIJ06617.1 Flagellar hook-length control protein FliK [Edwardsiella anguillarum ET080813]AKR78142.1 flagellar hook-length control protein FliK [Edwardsiella sp. LADL05-105]KAB0593254.1 flagellar hook-length control protein FliK [Edwardsiella anguillarum]UOU77818.1 flagellar hook-length control protein FliK [Edwardsiella anguillarum]WHP82532.1 flagellar hook-length control protein FliK [Edwardsiella anguillarum]